MSIKRAIVPCFGLQQQSLQLYDHQTDSQFTTQRSRPFRVMLPNHALLCALVASITSVAALAEPHALASPAQNLVTTRSGKQVPHGNSCAICTQKFLYSYCKVNGQCP